MPLRGWSLSFVGIVFQLLFFSFCLSSIGEILRAFIRRSVGLFGDLGLLRAFVLDIYLGGFVLYVIAIVPLQLFSPVVLYSVTIAAIASIFVLHRWTLVELLRNLVASPRRLILQSSSHETRLVMLVFLLSLFIQVLPLESLVFGSVRDTAIHSLFTQVLIENRQVPLTIRPYLAEGIVYPQGFAPMVAYAVFIFDCSPPEAVLYLTSFLNVLTVLGAYFLGSTLSPHGRWKMGLSLAFVFAFVAAWPKYITWGSNAFVAGLPLYFVCLSLLPFLAKERLNLRTIFTAGLLFGFLSVLHLQIYENLIASLFVLWLYLALKGAKDRWTRFVGFLGASSVSLLVLSPFIARQLAFYPNLYHNVGVPSDVVISIPEPSLGVVLDSVNWLAQNLAPNTMLKACSYGLIFASVLMIFAFRRRSSVIQTHELLKLGIATLLGQLLISLLAGISPLDLPFYPQPILLYFPIYFFIAALNYPIYNFIHSFISKRFLPKVAGSELNTRKLTVTAISAMLMVGIYSPFVYHSIAFDVGDLYGSYAVFGVTTEQDRKLMMWIKSNLPTNATVLVNNFQAGTFIPSIANRKAVFPSFGSSTSAGYQRLVGLLESGVINATALALLKRFNITDIYVGSGVSPWDGGKHKWEPSLFQGNPRFRLLKSFGNAYLFHVNYTETDIIFLDDFEHPAWYENGWQTQYAGNGLGNVTIRDQVGNNASQGLQMTAEAVYTLSECRYAYCIYRQLSVPSNSNIGLSFYLNASRGFNGEDTFAMIISSVHRNQSMMITTPNGFYSHYANVETLSSSEGLFSYNLSSQWRHFFNSSFPNTFVLEIVNWDFDGIENVVYLDNLTIFAPHAD